jgi:hypothetical protein
MMLLIQIDISPIYQTLKPLLQFSDKNDRPNLRDTVRDGSSFDRAVVLDGAILGLAAFVEHEYLDKHYPGYQVQTQAIKEHAGRSFDVVDFTTADGKSKTFYFALSEI